MIDARALHGWLGVGDRFDIWMRRRITEYGFSEPDDFCAFSHVRSDGRKGRPRKDYLLTLDTAKELAMVERTDLGRQTRRFVASGK